eukprot:gene20197-26941_t
MQIPDDLHDWELQYEELITSELKIAAGALHGSVTALSSQSQCYPEPSSYSPRSSIPSQNPHAGYQGGTSFAPNSRGKASRSTSPSGTSYAQLHQIKRSVSPGADGSYHTPGRRSPGPSVSQHSFFDSLYRGVSPHRLRAPPSAWPLEHAPAGPRASTGQDTPTAKHLPQALPPYKALQPGGGMHAGPPKGSMQPASHAHPPRSSRPGGSFHTSTTNTSAVRPSQRSAGRHTAPPSQPQTYSAHNAAEGLEHDPEQRRSGSPGPRDQALHSLGSKHGPKPVARFSSPGPPLPRPAPISYNTQGRSSRPPPQTTAAAAAAAGSRAYSPGASHQSDRVYNSGARHPDERAYGTGEKLPGRRAHSPGPPTTRPPYLGGNQHAPSSPPRGPAGANRSSWSPGDRNGQYYSSLEFDAPAGRAHITHAGRQSVDLLELDAPAGRAHITHAGRQSVDLMAVNSLGPAVSGRTDDTGGLGPAVPGRKDASASQIWQSSSGVSGNEQVHGEAYQMRTSSTRPGMGDEYDQRLHKAALEIGMLLPEGGVTEDPMQVLRSSADRGTWEQPQQAGAGAGGGGGWASGAGGGAGGGAGAGGAGTSGLDSLFFTPQAYKEYAAGSQPILVDREVHVAVPTQGFEYSGPPTQSPVLSPPQGFEYSGPPTQTSVLRPPQGFEYSGPPTICLPSPPTHQRQQVTKQGQAKTLQRTISPGPRQPFASANSKASNSASLADRPAWRPNRAKSPGRQGQPPSNHPRQQRQTSSAQIDQAGSRRGTDKSYDTGYDKLTVSQKQMPPNQAPHDEESLYQRHGMPRVESGEFNQAPPALLADEQADKKTFVYYANLLAGEAKHAQDNTRWLGPVEAGEASHAQSNTRWLGPGEEQRMGGSSRDGRETDLSAESAASVQQMMSFWASTDSATDSSALVAERSSQANSASTPVLANLAEELAGAPNPRGSWAEATNPPPHAQARAQGAAGQARPGQLPAADTGGGLIATLTGQLELEFEFDSLLLMLAKVS